MILACPACDARYSVADGAVPPEGRTVRCASCTHSWRATPTEAVRAAPAPVFTPEPVFASAPAAAAAPPPAHLPKRFRAKVQEERATRQAVAAGVVWAMLGAAFLTLLGGAALFRVQVVRLIPATAGAYAAVHLPVNPTGLALENVQGGPSLREGRAVMIVNGVLRNIEGAPRASSALKVLLIDKAGRAVAEQSLEAEGGPIAPGETRSFKAIFENPPISAAEFQVDFDFAAEKPKPAPEHRPAPPSLRAAHLEPPPVEPAVVHEASALPPDSPYALPTAAAAHGEHDAGHHP